MTDTKAFANVPLKTKKGTDKKNAVENITIEKAGEKLASNCGETALFIGRLMHENRLPKNTIIINCIDCVYAVEIEPLKFYAWLETQENIMISEHADKLNEKWNVKGVSYRFPGIEPGDKVTK